MFKKILLTVIIIVALIVLAIFVLQLPTGAPSKTPTVQQTVKYEPPPQLKTTAQVTEITSGQLPSAFPKGFPVEKGASVTQDLQAMTPEANQYSFSFISTKSLQANFDLYKKYFTDNNWKVVAQLNNANIKSLVAQKDVWTINININNTGLNEGTLVSLVLSEPTQATSATP